MNYIQAIILGGYHSGYELTVHPELKYLKLVEDKYEAPLYNKFSNTDEILVKVHEYRKVDTKFRKGHKQTLSGGSFWLESEDIGLFIPVESSKEYEDTLQKVLKKVFTVEWTPKQSGY